MATFHPFPRLPYTLRAQIWNLTVEPRCVDVQVKFRNVYVHTNPYLFSSTPVPAVLQSCREARSEGLYEQAFSEIAAPDGSGRRYVWVNWNFDIISVGTALFDCYKPVAPLLRLLKFERQITDEFFYHREIRDLRLFSNVKEIHVVCADGLRAWHGALEEHYWPCGKENVFMIDPKDGRMMRGIELDEMFDQVLREDWRREGYDYPSGEPLT